MYDEKTSVGMRSVESGTTATRPYEESMNQLDKEIAVLEDGFISLANKLQPILRGQAAQNDKEAVPVEESSPLVAGLRGFRRRVAELNRKLNELRESVEL